MEFCLSVVQIEVPNIQRVPCGGTIELASVSGEGATFTVWLPASPAPAPASPSSAESERPAVVAARG